jgi:hypothetical protein
MAAFQVITEGGCECSVRSVPPEVGVVLIRTLNRLDKVAGFPNTLLGGRATVPICQLEILSSGYWLSMHGTIIETLSGDRLLRRVG